MLIFGLIEKTAVGKGGPRETNVLAGGEERSAVRSWGGDYWSSGPRCQSD